MIERRHFGKGKRALQENVEPRVVRVGVKPIYGLREEYGRISHTLAAISNRPTFSLSEQPHRTVNVRIHAI